MSKATFIANYRNQYIPIKNKQVACSSREFFKYAILNSEKKYYLDHQSLDEVEDLTNPN